MCQDDDISPEPVRISIVQYFEDMPDPRAGPNAVHKLIDIIVIAVCAVIAGCEACTQMAEYGRRKEAWLRQFLELPRGIPSHDTFSRVLALLNAKKFQECFMRWATALHKATGGKIVAIDGKTLRRSFDNANGRGPIHLVSAWCSQNHISLGQLAVDAKPTKSRQFPSFWSCWRFLRHRHDRCGGLPCHCHADSQTESGLRAGVEEEPKHALRRRGCSLRATAIPTIGRPNV